LITATELLTTQGKNYAGVAWRLTKQSPLLR
jgi:hypothetical protein